MNDMSIITAHQEKKIPSRGRLFPWMVLIKGNSCVPFNGETGTELDAIPFDPKQKDDFKRAYQQAESVIDRNCMLAEADFVEGVS